MTRKLLPSLILLFLLAGGFSVRAEEPVIPNFWDTRERLPKPDVSALPRLRFLTTVDFPPFNFLDSRGKLAGFHIDLARAICTELGLLDKCQIQALPWDELPEALAAGQGEAIIAGLAPTVETRKTYLFSRSYMRFPARFIMPKASAVSEPLFNKLDGKRIGVIAGSAHERMLRDEFPNVRPITFSTRERVLADLKAGKLDGAFGDGMRYAFWLAGTDSAGCCRFAGGPYLAPEYLGSGLAIATTKANPALVAAFDYALREIHAKGVFAELYLRYFPVSFY